MPRRMFNREPNLKLEAALKAAAQHIMTSTEIAAQRRSWVIGELMLQHEDMTRNQAIAIYESVLAPVSCPCCERGK